MRLDRPLLLTPDNFTPRHRTPWGGTRIAGALKAGLLTGGDPARVVGESWEVSVEPDFPSRLESGALLSEVLASDPRAALGAEAALGRRGTALLVKLLDAADELSVQIHPTDDYAGLAVDQSGKPESWYVVAREAGAGLYLGLRDGVTREAMARALSEGSDVSQLLYFVPVEPGDFFVIEAGTAHAIGRGVTLVEPQHVVPGRRGVTYRYWDWNRTYDAEGRPDPTGEPRALHANEALDVTDWDAPREEALLARIRSRSGPPLLDAPPSLLHLSGPGGAIPSRHLDVRRLSGHGDIPLDDRPMLRAVTVLEGAVGLEVGAEVTHVVRGRSAVVPACVTGLSAALEHAHALVSAVVCGP